MNNKEITKIALKVFSIYVLVQALLLIPQQYHYYLIMGSNGSEYANGIWLSAISIISIISLFIISALIWKLSNKVTQQLDLSNTSNHLAVSETSILSILGLYLVFYGLFKLATTSISTYFLMNMVNEVNNDVIHNISYLPVYLIIIVLGASLIFKAYGWLAVLTKLRTIGSK